MLVKATDKYEKLNIQDNELKRIPKEGEQWEVSVERYGVLKGNNKYKTTFVEAVDIVREPVKIENKEEKPAKKTTRKKKE